MTDMRELLAETIMGDRAVDNWGNPLPCDYELADAIIAALPGMVNPLVHIEQLEKENEKLRKGLEIYQRERDRFRHANPEMTGAYFLSGGHGIKDDNQMPHFVEVVPAYGCGWSMVYENTGRTISYEGS